MLVLPKDPARCAFQVELEIIITMEHVAPKTTKALLVRLQLMQRTVTSVRHFLWQDTPNSISSAQ